MTLNQIIAKIQTAAESHKMVGKFGVGQQSNMTVGNIEYYPLVWLYPDGFNLNTTSSLMTYNFALLVMDRVFESESNVIEVLSDTAQIIADIFALIDNNTIEDEDFELVVTSNATPFYDAKTDILSGYAINFQVNTPYLFNTCVVPV
jgi:6-phosphogluconate dehydrogenase (decarboxylating)